MRDIPSPLFDEEDGEELQDVLPPEPEDAPPLI